MTASRRRGDDFSLPAGNSRRRRRLKKPGALAPGFTGVWGRSATNKHAPGIYRRIACHYYRTSPKASTILLYFSFNLSDKLTWAHIQSIGNFPKCFKIGLFIPVLNHRQMGTGNSREATQNILGYALFIAKIAYRPPNCTIVELHRLTPLPQQIVYEKTRK